MLKKILKENEMNPRGQDSKAMSSFEKLEKQPSGPGEYVPSFNSSQQVPALNAKQQQKAEQMYKLLEKESPETWKAILDRVTNQLTEKRKK